MKKSIKILSIALLFSLVFLVEPTFAGNIQGLNFGAKEISGNTSIAGAVNEVGFKMIDIVRYIFSGVLVIVVMYFGMQMIMSMGSNEEDITSAKNGFIYSAVGLIFINFPFSIYNALVTTSGEKTNFVINVDIFKNFIIQIINFLEIIVVGIAVIVLIIAGIKLMTSRGREERISEAKHKVMWVLIALVFIGFIEAYKSILIAKGGLNFGKVTNIFNAAASMLLYVAGPVIMVFLTLAGYYYITSNGDEERAKKGKSIIINTIIGIILMLCCYVILNDISFLI